jgi:hypothetical protein
MFQGFGRGAPGGPALFNEDGTPVDGVQATTTGVTPLPAVHITGAGGLFDTSVLMTLPLIGEVPRVYVVGGAVALGVYFMFFHEDGKKR